jgi:dihydrofolate synthase/folylpolyglutamate synthase
VNYPDSVRFLYALGNESKTMKLGLERMLQVCAALGHPERRLRFIHVAGTNGKGSTCAMVEAGLRLAGHRTGLYTSPHLVSPTERIRVNGEPVAEEVFAALFNRVHESVSGLPEHPTYFETITAMALLHFADAGCGWVVWEVGLGGRLDATNVVTPALTAITPISFDHMEYLGHTIEAIAGEKAGILKPGVPVAVSRQCPEARAVIERRANQLGCPVIDATGVNLPFDPPLAGEHQRDNARTAIAILQHLGVPADGIRATRWPGRIEKVRSDPDTYLDGAHNAAGAEALAAFLEREKRGRRVWLIFGVMRDKDALDMGRRLFPLADEIILTAAKSERAMPPDQIAAPASAHRAPGIVEALQLVSAAAPGDLVLITGSLYLVGEARPLLL